MRRARAIIARRRILFLLVGRDLKVRYSDSTLGYLWTIIDPLLMGLVYWFVFDVIFDRGKDIAGSPYLPYLMLGLLGWQWASGSINGCARALSGEAKLIRSVDVPREMWILRIIASRFVEFMFTIPLLAALAIGYGLSLHWEVLWVPLAIVMQATVLMGIGLALAPLTVMVPDVERILRVATRAATYMCPVIYGAFAVLEADLVPRFVQQIYAWNPFATILSLYRAGFYPDDPPDYDVMLRGGISCLVVLALGIVIFRKLEAAVLKEI